MTHKSKKMSIFGVAVVFVISILLCLTNLTYTAKADDNALPNEIDTTGVTPVSVTDASFIDNCFVNANPLPAGSSWIIFEWTWNVGGDQEVSEETVDDWTGLFVCYDVAYSSKKSGVLSGWESSAGYESAEMGSMLEATGTKKFAFSRTGNNKNWYYNKGPAMEKWSGLWRSSDPNNDYTYAGFRITSGIAFIDFVDLKCYDEFGNDLGVFTHHTAKATDAALPNYSDPDAANYVDVSGMTSVTITDEPAPGDYYDFDYFVNANPLPAGSSWIIFEWDWTIAEDQEVNAVAVGYDVSYSTSISGVLDQYNWLVTGNGSEYYEMGQWFSFEGNRKFAFSRTGNNKRWETADHWNTDHWAGLWRWSDPDSYDCTYAGFRITSGLAYIDLTNLKCYDENGNDLGVITHHTQIPVTFDSNGGSAVAAGAVTYANNKISAPTAPTKAGSHFDYWYADDESVAFDFANTAIEAPLTLTAHWTEHTFGEWIDEVPATETAAGTKGHKDCTGCEKHFDADGNEITDLTIPQLTPATDPATDPATTPSDKTPAEPEKKGGCGSAIGGSEYALFAMIITFAAVMVFVKRKLGKNK